MSLLLTDNASPGWDDAGISGGKIGDRSDITYFTYFFSMDRKHVTMLSVDNTEYYC